MCKLVWGRRLTSQPVLLLLTILIMKIPQAITPTSNPPTSAVATTITESRIGSEHSGAISAVDRRPSGFTRQGSGDPRPRPSTRQRANTVAPCDAKETTCSSTRNTSLPIDTPLRRNNITPNPFNTNFDELRSQSSQDWGSPSSQRPHSGMLSCGRGRGMDNLAYSMTIAKSVKRSSDLCDPRSVGIRSPRREAGSPPAADECGVESLLDFLSEDLCFDVSSLEPRSDPQSTGVRDAGPSTSSRGKSPSPRRSPSSSQAGLGDPKAVRMTTPPLPEPIYRVSFRSVESLTKPGSRVMELESRKPLSATATDHMAAGRGKCKNTVPG